MRDLFGRWTQFGALALASAAAAQSPRVRDSAGVRLVENGSRAAVPTVFRVSDKPIYDVGGLEDVPANEFDPKQGYLRGVRLSNGGLAVIDVHRVQYFDAKGKRLKIVSREGQGPGELSYATSICRTRADTIVVGDRSKSVVFDGQGNFVRDINYDGRGYSTFNGCFTDGTFFIERYLPAPVAAPRTARLTRLRLDGTEVGPFADLPIGVFDVSTGREPTFAAADTRLYFGDGLKSEVKIVEAASAGPRPVVVPQSNVGRSSEVTEAKENPVPVKMLGLIRTDDQTKPITDAEREARWAATIPNNVSPDERKQRMDRMRSLPHADAWPAYRRLHVDETGRLWLQDYTTDFTQNSWVAFDSTGKMLGRLQLPPRQPRARFEVVGFGKDEILICRTDDDGAAHLSAYRIQRIK